MILGGKQWQVHILKVSEDKLDDRLVLREVKKKLTNVMKLIVSIIELVWLYILIFFILHIYEKMGSDEEEATNLVLKLKNL